MLHELWRMEFYWRSPSLIYSKAAPKKYQTEKMGGTKKCCQCQGKTRKKTRVIDIADFTKDFTLKKKPFLRPKESIFFNGIGPRQG